MVLANPLPTDLQLDPDLHDRTLADGLAVLTAEGVTGKDVTPRLLEYFHAATHGESLRVNVELVLANARLAGEMAVVLADTRGRTRFSRTAVPVDWGHSTTCPHVTVIGDVGLDVLARVAGPVALGQDTRARVTVAPGGAGGNTAAWLARHDLDVTLIARVGADEAGRTAAAELSAAGVAAGSRSTRAADLLRRGGGRARRRPDHAVRPRRERGAVPPTTSPGAGDRPRTSAPVGIRPAGQRFPPGRAGRAAAGDAMGWTTSVDPQAAPHLAAAGAGNFLSWVDGVDLLLPNDSELEALGGAEAGAGGGTAVVVTHGRDGASWLTATETSACPLPATGRRRGAPRRRPSRRTPPAPVTPSTPGCSPPGCAATTRDGVARTAWRRAPQRPDGSARGRRRPRGSARSHDRAAASR